MAFEEFLEDPLSLVCEDFLDTRDRLQERRGCQDLEAELHPLDVVVHVHGLLCPFQERADDQRGLDGHLVEFFDV